MIEQLIAETTECDFKEAVERAKPKSWLKSVSAFANTKGGTLVFGVSDEGHEVVGLQSAQADADFISQTIRDRIDPVPPFEISVEREGGKDVLVVVVEEGDTPPYYYRADGRMEAYLRVGNSSSVVDATQQIGLILKGTHQSWDALDSGINAGDVSFSILKATFANRMNDRLDDADLTSFGLLTDHGTLTNAGALLADGPLVRHSRIFCTRFVGYMENDFEDTAEYEGSLLFMLREAQAFVKRHTLESWEKTDDSRIERRDYSTRAVEEALVNAFVHRSYLILGSEVHVDIYDDRLEISSPGGKPGAPLPEDVERTRIKSERRNPIVADVLSRMNLMERRGTGLREICRLTSIEDAYRPDCKPKFESDEYSFTVTLYNMNYVAKSPGSSNGSSKFLEVPQSSPDEQVNTAQLSANELATLVFVQERGDATAPEIANVLGMTRRGATKLLARLVDRGVLKTMGSGNVTRYTIPD